MSAFAVLLGLGGMLVLLALAESGTLPLEAVLAGVPGVLPLLVLSGAGLSSAASFAAVGLASTVVALIALWTSRATATA